MGWVASLGSIAVAQSAQANLNVKAGLAPTLTLTCHTALSFGTTRLIDAAAVATTTLTLIAASGAITNPTIVGIIPPAFGTPGKCTLQGSEANDGQNLTIFIGTSTTVASSATIAISGANILGLGAANTTITVNNFTLDPLIPEVEEKKASFAIGADLIIPANPGANGIGGYQGAITVFVSDTI